MTCASASHAITEALASTPTKWGSSRWGEWQRCQQAHHLRHVLRVVPRPRPDDADVWEADDPSYFAVGQLVHSCLAFGGIVMRDSLVTTATWADVLARAADGGSDSGAIYECERLMLAYEATWGDIPGWPAGTEVLAVEVELADMIGGLPYTARADMILRLPGGQVVVVDHKTRAQNVPGVAGRAPNPGKTAQYVRGLATRPQFLGLSHLAGLWLRGRDEAVDAPVPVWVNAIVKTKIPAFWRGLVTPSWEAIRAWHANHEHEAETFQRLGALGAQPLRNYGQCAPDIGSRCAYFMHCHGSAEERDMYYETKGNAQ